MDGSIAVSDRHRGSRRGVPDPARTQFNRYDQSLLAAKNAGKYVRFDLATETCFSDDEGTVTGFVTQVDTESVEIQIEGTRKVWITKCLVVSTEVLG